MKRLSETTHTILTISLPVIGLLMIFFSHQIKVENKQNRSPAAFFVAENK